MRIKRTNHCPVAQKRAARAERVREYVERLDRTGLEVPKGAPRRMVVDLQRVVGGTVEEHDERRRDNDGLESDDARALHLEVESPARCGRRRDSDRQESRE